MLARFQGSNRWIPLSVMSAMFEMNAQHEEKGSGSLQEALLPEIKKQNLGRVFSGGSQSSVT